MKLGDILGTLSPAYGLVTGHGLGGLARDLSPLFLLLSQMNKGHNNDGQTLGDMMHQQNFPEQGQHIPGQGGQYATPYVGMGYRTPFPGIHSR
jgi:hypothetical protein